MAVKATSRLDSALVERGLAESRAKAQALILAGQVMVAGQVATRAAGAVRAEAEIEVIQRQRYVSRGGLKLERALDAFKLDVAGQKALDVGASTGGFTDCLLQRGAAKVIAVDVGYGQLAWRLRNDPRVVVLDRTNIRYLERLPAQPDGATIDVSFISLDIVLPAVARLLSEDGWIIALVKPQFEAGREQVGKGGVIRRPEVQQQVLKKVAQFANSVGYGVFGAVESPITGPAGNREFFLYLKRGEGGLTPEEASQIALVTDGG